MSNKVVNTLSVAVGAALLGTVMAANASNPFSLNDLGQGYQVGDKAAEAKCGKGSCGANKGKPCMEMKEKADQDKCMADAKKGGEAKCSADKKGAEAKCSADKKGAEAKCSGDKGKEKSCSHG